MKLMFLIFFSALTLFVRGNGNPSAPKMIIAGVVQEAGTDETLPGVKVSIEGTEFFTFTDKDGLFSFEQIPQGNYILRFSLVSFNNEQLQINSAQSSTLPLSVELNPR